MDPSVYLEKLAENPSVYRFVCVFSCSGANLVLKDFALMLSINIGGVFVSKWLSSSSCFLLSEMYYLMSFM